jgi:hypothetical protein
MKENIFAYTKISDVYYPAFVSINKYDTTGEVSIIVRSEHETSPMEVEVVIPTSKLVEMAESILKSNGAVSDQPAMAHFLALMESLEIPNPDWWLAQHPGMLKLVGKYIAKQAKEVYDAEQNK